MSPDAGTYGIWVRNLVARSGDGSEFLRLLDNRGCPLDPQLFSALDVSGDGKSLRGRFEAFKFARDAVVRFQLSVQFCSGPCPKVRSR